MSFLSGLGDIGSGLWQATKNVGDFAGLDGSLGYQGTWNQQPNYGYMDAGVGSINVQPQSNSMFGGLGDWLSNQNSKDWNNYANMAKSLGGIGLGYMNYQQGKKLTDAQMQQMALDQQYQAEADDRRKRNANNISLGFQNSSLGQGI